MTEPDWKYYDVTHTLMDNLNPILPHQMDRLVELPRLEKGALVYDIACGKGEFLMRLQERYGIVGDGVDLSPFKLEEARRRVASRIEGNPLKFHLMDGAEFKAEKPADLACCIGATWIWNGFKGTAQALADMVKTGGMILIGEPYWRAPPPEEYLALSTEDSSNFLTLESLLATARDQGLRFLYVLETGQEAFDHYYSMYALSLREYQRLNPDDPDIPRIRERMELDLSNYFRWERSIMAWALFLFEKP